MKNNIENPEYSYDQINSMIEDYDNNNYNSQIVKRFIADTKHRKGLIFWVKYVVSIWLLLVIFVVALNSVLSLNLKESVLITLLTTTTVNILGLAYIVLKGLFEIKT